MNDIIFEAIKEIVGKNEYGEELTNIIFNLYDYIHQINWWGSCHVSSSVLYVALKEKGFEPVLWERFAKTVTCLTILG